MQEFDPRRPTFRVTPRLAIGLAGLAALAVGWKLAAVLQGWGGARLPAVFRRGGRGQ